MNTSFSANPEPKPSNCRNNPNPAFFLLNNGNQENMNMTNMRPSENQNNEMSNSKSSSKPMMQGESNQGELSLYPFYISDSLIISPVKDYHIRDYAFTPLKNESGYYSPLIPFEFRIDTPNEQSMISSITVIEYGSSARRVLFSKEKNPILGRKINFNNNCIEEPHKGLEVKICCTCTKTNCQKKYCACFGKGRYCQGCDCKNCFNQPIGNSSFVNPVCNPVTICNCTKSNCTKKYCECFKVGKKCTASCRCVNCINSLRKVEPSEHRLLTEAYGIEITKGKMSIKRRSIEMDMEIHYTPKNKKKRKMRMKTESTRLNTTTPTVNNGIMSRHTRIKRKRSNE